MVGLAPAMAQNTGIYIGVNGGYQNASTELDLNAPAPIGSLLNLNGVAHNGPTGGMQGGFDYRWTGTPFVLGVFAEWLCTRTPSLHKKSEGCTKTRATGHAHRTIELTRQLD